MTAGELMQVSLRLPARLLWQGRARRLQAVAEHGSFGMLPHHTDFVASLVPSVLVVEGVDGERFFGIDHGLLVKRGDRVDIAVHRGVAGEALDSLAESVAATFVDMDEEERQTRTALSRLELGIVRHFSELRKPRP